MKKQNIEVEGGEILIKSEEGHYAVIPSKDRRKIKDMIKRGFSGGINRYLKKLPNNKSYAKKGSTYTGDEDLVEVLNSYIATANSGKYKTLEELNSKFPELSGFDKDVLNSYIATANSGKYKTLEELNSKFPELFKKKSTEQNTSENSQEPLQQQQESNAQSNSSEDIGNTSNQNGIAPPNYGEQLQQDNTQVQQNNVPQDIAALQASVNDLAAEKTSSEKVNQEQANEARRATERIELSNASRVEGFNKEDEAKLQERQKAEQNMPVELQSAITDDYYIQKQKHRQEAIVNEITTQKATLEEVNKELEIKSKELADSRIQSGAMGVTEDQLAIRKQKEQEYGMLQAKKEYLENSIDNLHQQTTKSYRTTLAVLDQQEKDAKILQARQVKGTITPQEELEYNSVISAYNNNIAIAKGYESLFVPPKREAENNNENASALVASLNTGTAKTINGIDKAAWVINKAMTAPLDYMLNNAPLDPNKKSLFGMVAEDFENNYGKSSLDYTHYEGLGWDVADAMLEFAPQIIAMGALPEINMGKAIFAGKVLQKSEKADAFISKLMLENVASKKVRDIGLTKMINSGVNLSSFAQYEGINGFSEAIVQGYQNGEDINVILPKAIGEGTSRAAMGQIMHVVGKSSNILGAKVSDMVLTADGSILPKFMLSTTVGATASAAGFVGLDELTNPNSNLESKTHSAAMALAFSGLGVVEASSNIAKRTMQRMATTDQNIFDFTRGNNLTPVELIVLNAKVREQMTPDKSKAEIKELENISNTLNLMRDIKLAEVIGKESKEYQDLASQIKSNSKTVDKNLKQTVSYFNKSIAEPAKYVNGKRFVGDDASYLNFIKSLKALGADFTTKVDNDPKLEAKTNDILKQSEIDNSKQDVKEDNQESTDNKKVENKQDVKEEINKDESPKYTIEGKEYDTKEEFIKEVEKDPTKKVDVVNDKATAKEVKGIMDANVQKTNKNEVEEKPTKEEADEIKIDDSELEDLKKEITDKESEGSLKDNIGKKAYKGSEEGMIKEDGQSIVFETNDRIYELGNKNDIGDNNIVSEGLSLFPQEGIKAEEKSNKPNIVTIDGKRYTFISKGKNKKGRSVIKVKDSNGLIRRIYGDKAERVFKDISLQNGKNIDTKQKSLDDSRKRNIENAKAKDDKRKEKIALKKSKKEAKIEYELKTEDELAAMEKKAAKDVANMEKEILSDALKESKNRLGVSVNGNGFMVRDKGNGEFAVSQKNDKGKYVGIKDSKKREAAISEYKKIKEENDDNILKVAEELIEDYKKEQDDKIIKWLDDRYESLNSNGRLYDATIGIPIFIAKGGIKIIKATYKAGKSLSEAIKNGVAYIKSQGYNVNEYEYKKWVLGELSNNKEKATTKGNVKQDVREKPFSKIRDLKKQGKIKGTDKEIDAAESIWEAVKGTWSKVTGKSKEEIESNLNVQEGKGNAKGLKQRGKISITDKHKNKYRKGDIDNKYDVQAIETVGMSGVKMDKQSIKTKIKNSFNGLKNGIDKYMLTEDGAHIDKLIDTEIKIAKKDGWGKDEVTRLENLAKNPEGREKYIKEYYDAQENTIGEWIDGMESGDYPIGFKYLMLDAIMTNNFENGKFVKRTSKTARNFLPFNKEAVDEVYKNQSDDIVKDYVESQVKMANKDIVKRGFVATDKDGGWIKYDGGSKAAENAEDLAGFVAKTPWCTKTLAEAHLEGGDFYVYATKSDKGIYEPRIAIRMEGDKVGEVRGIKEGQGIEGTMIPKANKFLNNIEGGKQWIEFNKYNEDVIKLREKIEANGKVSDADIDEYIEYLGKEGEMTQDYSKRNGNVEYLEDTINELRPEISASKVSDITDKTIVLNSRLNVDGAVDLKNVKHINGFVNILGNGDVVIEGLENIKIVKGLSVDANKISGLESLETIGGYANFGKLTNAKGLESLKTIEGDAIFYNLTNAKGLESLKTIGGGADFRDLTNANGLESLETIGGDANFRNLTNAKGLESLKTIGGEAYFRDLTNANGLESLETIGGDADFRDLTNAKGLESLKTIRGYANFYNLTNAKGLESLETIGGNVNFYNLTNTKGLESLKTIGGGIYFRNLTNANGLESLESIGGGAEFKNLTNANGLESLKTIGGYVDFSDLTNAKGLESLKTIEGNAYFNNLTNAEGLESLKTIGGDAKFDNLTNAKGLESLKTIGGGADFRDLTNAKGLESLKTIEGNAYFENLTDAKGLESLESIGADAYFSNLTNAKGLESLESIGGDIFIDKLKNSKGLESLKTIEGDVVANDKVKAEIEANRSNKLIINHLPSEEQANLIYNGLEKEKLWDKYDEGNLIIKRAKYNGRGSGTVKDARLNTIYNRNIYDKLLKVLGTKDEVSSFLNRNGIDGVADKLYQNNESVKGSIEFFNNSKATVNLFKEADPTTILHEFAGGHLGRRALEDMAKSDKTFAKHYDNVKKWAGVKDDKWGVKSEEKFARAWEKYLSEGKAPTTSLQKVFDTLKDLFDRVYTSMKSILGEELTPEVRSAFDAMLGKKESKGGGAILDRIEANSKTKKKITTLKEAAYKAYNLGKSDVQNFKMQLNNAVNDAIKEGVVNLTPKQEKVIRNGIIKAKTAKAANRIIDKLNGYIDSNTAKYEVEAKQRLIDKTLRPNRFEKSKGGEKPEGKGKYKNDAQHNRFFDNVVSINNGGTMRVGNIDMPTATEKDRENILQAIDKGLDKAFEKDDQREIDDLALAKVAIERYSDLTTGSYQDVKAKIEDFENFRKNTIDFREYVKTQKKYTEYRNTILDLKPIKDNKKDLSGESGSGLLGINMLGNKNTNGIYEVIGGLGDGGRIFSNPLHKTIKEDINNAELKHNDYSYGALEKFSDVLKNVYGKNINAKTARDSVKESTNIDKQNADGTTEKRVMSRAEAIQTYMLSKNENLRETLLLPYDKDKQTGNGYTEESLKELEAFIGEDGKKIADGMFKLYEQMYNDQNEVYRRVNGADLNKEDYYAGQVFRANNSIQDTEMNAPRGLNKYLTNGSHKNRVKTTSTIREDSYINVFNRSVKETSNYIAFRETVDMLNNTLLYPTVINKIKQAFGTNMKKELEWERDILAGNITIDKSLLDDISLVSRKGILYIKTSTGLKQLASMAMYMSEMPLNSFAKRAGKAVTDTGIEASIKRDVVKPNAFVKYRNVNNLIGLDAVEYTRKKKKVSTPKLVGKNTVKAKKAAAMTGAVVGKAYDRAGSFMIRYADKAPITIGGTAYVSWRAEKYKGAKITEKDIKAYKEGKDTKGASALRKAMSDFVVIAEATQQSTFRSNIARNRTQTQAGRAFNTFSSAQHQLSILARSSYQHMYSGNKKQKAQGAKQLAAILATQAMISFITNKGDGDAEDYAYDLAYAATVMGIPYVDNVGGAVKWGFKTGDFKTGNPSADLAYKIGENITKTINAKHQDTKEKYAYRAFESAATLVGIPAGNVRKEYEGMKQIYTGTSDNPFWSAIGQPREANYNKKGDETLKQYKERLSEIDKEQMDEIKREAAKGKPKKNIALSLMYKGGKTGDFITKYYNPMTTSYSVSNELKLKYLEDITDGDVKEMKKVLIEGKGAISRDLFLNGIWYLNHKDKYKLSTDFPEKVEKDRIKYKKIKENLDKYEN